MTEEEVKKIASQYLKGLTPHLLSGDTEEAHRWLCMAIREAVGTARFQLIDRIERAIDE
tara:strand:+ start:379 stop:555 length:177 start_codon:yes stop_codon:yes gene_type:complete